MSLSLLYWLWTASQWIHPLDPDPDREDIGDGRESEVAAGWSRVVALSSHVFSIREKTAIVACSLTGTTALAPPRQADMVRGAVVNSTSTPSLPQFGPGKLTIRNTVRRKKSSWALRVLRSGIWPA